MRELTLHEKAYINAVEASVGKLSSLDTIACIGAVKRGKPVAEKVAEIRLRTFIEGEG